MRWISFLFFTLFVTQSGFAQIQNPVTWSTQSESLGDGEFRLTWTAHIESGWYIYSQFIEEGGPIPTAFYFDEGDHFSRIEGVVEKGKTKSGFDELFGMDVIKLLAPSFSFEQRVKVTDYSQPISGEVEFMVCNQEQCLPPDLIPFSFQLEAAQMIVEATPKSPEATTENLSATTTAASAEAETVPATTLAPLELREAPNNSGLLDPIDWTLRVNPSSIDNRYEVVFKADLTPGWTLYSQENDPDKGPIPTAIFFDTESVDFVGPVMEEGGKRKSGIDEFFGVNVVKYISGPVTFSGTIEVPAGTTEVTGYVEYMTCDDSQCLPGDLPFSLSFDPLTGSLGTLSGASPMEFDLAITNPDADLGLDATPLGLPSINNEPIGNCELPEQNIQKGSGLLTIFGLGFIGGLLALLTPCVFPMIPLTVSFFTKGSNNRSTGIRNASLYGFFIVLVYLLLSIPFHLMDSLNPDILNELSTNVFLNVFFFAVFVFFAFSFFGYYELTLPDKWTNQSSQAEGIGGFVGIFFMALTLALVSFSCTGPILGSLLVGALTAEGGAMQLTAGMGGFGLALALPFTLFAVFPQFMSSLPKSGGWLNSVKVVLGFVELALAFKFLSNADLVKHWGVLRIEPFLLIWILCGLGIALYLFGLIRFPHDSAVRKITPLRATFGGLAVAMVLYLLSGFLPDERSGSYRPLGLLSGIAPPVCYSFFQECDCPQNLDCFKDLETGLAYAQQVDKPVLIDFTGYACVNCRKMEEHVWPEPEVYPLLKDDYVLISLYVDDKEALPEEEQITVTRANGGERRLRDKGDRWAHFQAETFQVNTQPFYVLMSPDGQVLNQPVSYTPEPAEYADFLQCGLSNFEQLTELRKQKERVLGSAE